MKYLGYLAVLLIGALLAWAIIPHNENKQALLDAKKVIERKTDSIELLIQRIQDRETYWMIIHQERVDSFKVALDKVKQYKQKYEKPTPVIHYSEPQLDSVIRAIIR